MKSSCNSEKLSARIDAGVRAGVAAALNDLKQAGVPVWIEEDGELIQVQPEDIPEDGILLDAELVSAPAAMERP